MNRSDPMTVTSLKHRLNDCKYNNNTVDLHGVVGSVHRSSASNIYKYTINSVLLIVVGRNQTEY